MLAKFFSRAITLCSAILLGSLMILGGCESPTGSDEGGDNQDDPNPKDEHPFAGGEGGFENPYEIETLVQLDSVRNYLKSNFILISDIDASESDAQGFNPIGDEAAASGNADTFEGTLDGNGHTISNLTIDFTFEGDREFGVGVFNGINGGSVKNITFENLSVTVDVESSTTPDGFFVGGLAGHVMDSTTVENVTVKGSMEASDISKVGGLIGRNMGYIVDSKVAMDITGSSDSTGGMVGFNRSVTAGIEISGKIENVDVSGTIEGKNHVGGAVGSNKRNTIIKGIRFSGEVQGNKNVGGLVGTNRGPISDSEANARVKGNGDNIGGLVGLNVENISASSARGKVTGTNRIGGLVGWGKIGEVINSEATGNVEGSELVGGLVGFNSSADIKDSNAEGDVSGTEGVGGLVGDAQSKTTVINSEATGNVQGDRMVGGLAGYSSSQEILKCSAIGTVTAEGKYVGGLIGRFDNGGSISESSAEGDVSGNRQVGGLTGNTTAGTITKSFATGNVDGQYQVGGFVGITQKETQISESYAAGSVSGSTNIGGLVGWLMEESVIEKSYARGDVTGGSSSGGITGYASDNAEIRNSYSVGEVVASSRDTESGGLVGSFGDAELAKSYWDTSKSAQQEGVGNRNGGTITDIEGLSTADMQGTSAEKNMTAFDWSEIWVTTNNYPALFWE